jgi:hypothetical protein
MLDIKDFLVSGISENYTISKIDISYLPFEKKIGENLKVKGHINTSFIDSNDNTRETSLIFENDIYSYFYSIATGTDAQKNTSATTNTLNLFKDLNNGIEQPAIDMIMGKYNLTF